MATELEYFLFEDSYESSQEKAYRNLKTFGAYNESMAGLTTCAANDAPA